MLKPTETAVINKMTLMDVKTEEEEADSSAMKLRFNRINSKIHKDFQRAMNAEMPINERTQ